MLTFKNKLKSMTIEQLEQLVEHFSQIEDYLLAVDFVPPSLDLQNLPVLDYSNTYTVTLNNIMKYDKYYLDCLDDLEVLEVDHCKTKVKTMWKGKHCKPFYQTSRW